MGKKCKDSMARRSQTNPRIAANAERPHLALLWSFHRIPFPGRDPCVDKPEKQEKPALNQRLILSCEGALQERKLRRKAGYESEEDSRGRPARGKQKING